MITKTKQVGDPDSDLREAFKVVNISKRSKIQNNQKIFLNFDEIIKPQVFDIDGDGIITHRELRLIMNSLGQEVSAADIDEMIKEADSNCRKKNVLAIQLFKKYLY